MSLADVLFLMGFAAVWGGVVGWNLGADREASRFARTFDKFTLPVAGDRRSEIGDRKGGGL